MKASKISDKLLAKHIENTRFTHLYHCECDQPKKQSISFKLNIQKSHLPWENSLQLLQKCWMPQGDQGTTVLYDSCSGKPCYRANNTNIISILE